MKTIKHPIRALIPGALTLALIGTICVLPVRTPAQVVANIGYLRTLLDPVMWLPTDTTTLFQTEGTVTTYTNITTTGNSSFYIQDGTGGIDVYVTGGSTIRPNAGDRVRVVGPLGTFASLLELNLVSTNPLHSVTTLSTGNALPSATPFNDFSLTNNLPVIEVLEGSLITITNAYFTTAPGGLFGSGVNYTITNALGQTFSLRVDTRVVDIIGQPIPAMASRLTGVLSQNLSTTAPNRTAGYQILPTRYVDIATNAVIGPAITTASPLNSGTAGTAYSQTLQKVSGTSPYTWSLASGSLPAGLTLAPASGVLSGTPTVPGTSYFRVRITDSQGLLGQKDFVLTVYAAVTRPAALSILTYNVNGADPTDWSTNSPKIQAIGREVMYLQPDIITFNEIQNTNTWQLTNFVAAYLPGYYLATNSATDGWLRSAIVSRYPITRSTSWLNGSSLAAFGDPTDVFIRDLFEAKISVTGFAQPLHVFTTHLKAYSDSASALWRSAEAGAISNFFVTAFLTTNASHPYVLTGDLNEDVTIPASASPPIQRLANAATGLQLTTPVNPFNGSPLTESIRGALDIRFDYILPCGLLFSNIVSSQVFRTDLLLGPPPPLLAGDDATASDHLPVLMTFANPSVATRITLIGARTLTNGAFQFGFTNTPGIQFAVLATTNPTQPLSNWASLTGLAEVSPGQFQFTDPQATNGPRRFYRIRSP